MPTPRGEHPAKTSRPPVSGTDWAAELRRRLRAWFRRHGRQFPWRGTHDPYAVWVSEIMLQQTQTATVCRYYPRFLEAFPTVAALAAADEHDVLRLWEGLGYYRRARQLHQAAQAIVQQHGGVFPEDFGQVQALPGIGRYTAGAILSIARDAPCPILEANTLRLYSRLLGYRGDPRSAAGQRRLWQAAEAWLPRQGAGQFNQALMDLGATICTPRDPLCPRCPVENLCAARRHGWQHRIPPPPRRPKVEHVHEAAVVVRRGEKVLLVQHGPADRWAGLWGFVRFPVREAPSAGEVASLVQQCTEIAVSRVEPLAVVRHQVTRFRITLHCFMARWVRGARPAEQVGRWVRPAELSSYALSTSARRLARLVQSAMADRANGQIDRA